MLLPSERPLRKNPSRAVWTAGLGMIILVGIVALVLTDSSALEYYKHVDEVLQTRSQWQNKRLQLHGFVTPQSIEKFVDARQQRMTYRFTIENCGAQLPVQLSGVVPDTFKEGAEVVIKGTLDTAGTTFMATEVIAKCPSKYESSPKLQTEQTTRCSAEKTSKSKEDR